MAKRTRIESRPQSPAQPASEAAVDRERRTAEKHAHAAPREGDWTRRDFLRTGGAVGAGWMAGASQPARAANAPAEAPQIRARRPLGRTGIEVPDISFGTFALEREADTRLIEHALDRGITHFDTAEGYTEGRAERVLGRALRGRRDQVTLTTKFWAEPEHSAAYQMEKLDESLRQLGTDYVDIYMNHAVNDVARLGDEWQQFTQRAKQQGKVRAVGMSGHAARLSQCMEAALDASLVDVFLVAYNFAQQPSFVESLKSYVSDWLPSLDIVASQARLPSLLARAHDEGVGVMVMKTLKGARLNDMRAFEGPDRTFAQAAFRWVLSDPAVDGLVVTMTSPEQIDEYVAASGGGAPDREDLALLARYLARNTTTSCQVGCGECLSACPAGVPIPDVLRMRMYDEDYGQPEIAARAYRALETNAAACAGCTGTPCASACPTGILDLPGLARETHARLGGRLG